MALSFIRIMRHCGSATLLTVFSIEATEARFSTTVVRWVCRNRVASELLFCKRRLLPLAEQRSYHHPPCDNFICDCDESSVR